MMWKAPYESSFAPKQTGSVLIFFQFSEIKLIRYEQNECQNVSVLLFYFSCSKLQPRRELLGTPKEKLSLPVQFFNVTWHYLFFETPLPRKSTLTDRCESQWFEINIDLRVGRGRRRQSSFSSKTVKCPKSCDQGCS